MLLGSVLKPSLEHGFLELFSVESTHRLHSNFRSSQPSGDLPLPQTLAASGSVMASPLLRVTVPRCSHLHLKSTSAVSRLKLVDMSLLLK